jgi:predicted nucleotidyltransferase
MMGAADRPQEALPRTADLAEDAVRSAQVVFGADLLAAFVGGSRASGVHRDNSDIDALVLIERSDCEREADYAAALRKLHDTNGLAFDHYGEIFDRATLESLLRFTKLVDELFPEMAEAPCYRGNCMLSVYRKGRVLLEFLAGPKVHVLDPHGVLSELERRAGLHLASRRSSLPSPSDMVVLDPGTAQHRLREEWKADEADSGGLDTPVGVDLGRWFGSDLDKRGASLSMVPGPPAEGERITGLECPISQGSAPQGLLYVLQCLSVPCSKLGTGS